MTFFRSKSKNLTRLLTFKKDLAPIGFYFDIFTTSLFQIPILPLPLRIDKLANGQPTLFIIPDMKKLDKLFKRLNLSIDFQLFYTIGIENLIQYAQLKQKEITLRQIDGNMIRNWWVSSNNISACNLDLIVSFTFIISQFLKTYAFIEKSNLVLSQDKESYKNALLSYCNDVIKYLRSKIENNLFFLKIDNKIEKEQLFLEKKQKYYPLVIKIPVEDSRTKKTNEMGFVPYLIYDDLLDSFYYNKKLLTSPNNDSINLKVYEYNYLINKRSSNENALSNWNLKNINIEEIIQKLNIL